MMLQYLNQVYNARVKYIQDHQPGVPLLGDVGIQRNGKTNVKSKKITKPSIEKDQQPFMTYTILDPIKN